MLDLSLLSYFIFLHIFIFWFPSFPVLSLIALSISFNFFYCLISYLIIYWFRLYNNPLELMIVYLQTWVPLNLSYFNAFCVQFSYHFTFTYIIHYHLHHHNHHSQHHLFFFVDHNFMHITLLDIVSKVTEDLLIYFLFIFRASVWMVFNLLVS